MAEQQVVQVILALQVILETQELMEQVEMAVGQVVLEHQVL